METNGKHEDRFEKWKSPEQRRAEEELEIVERGFQRILETRGSESKRISSAL